MELIAARLTLPDVMARLAVSRPVFHSEADFQFAFGQAVADLDLGIHVRMEVPLRAERRTYVDMQCTAEQTSLIEFKYVTRTWTGQDGVTNEMFDLRSHEALDLARLYFVHDMTRLEAWVTEQSDTNGFAVLLSNDNRLWEPATSDRVTRDRNFRLHEGRLLTGDLTWGTAERPFERNDRHLRGSYHAEWHDYSSLDRRPGGNLRWLGFQVTG